MSAEARYCLESGCRSYDQAQYTIDGVKCNQCSSDTYTAIDALIDREARSRVEVRPYTHHDRVRHDRRGGCNMSAEARYCLESGCRSYDQAQYTIDGVKCNQCSSDTYTAIDASIDRDARSRPRKPADPINPIHYQAESGLESIEVIEAFGLNFNLGNAVKYILRAGKKTTDPTTDLQKAIWYLQREIEKCRKNTSA